MAGVLVVVLLLILAYKFMPSSSTIASTTSGTTATLPAPSAARAPGRRGSSAAAGKKTVSQSLDPTLHLEQLAVAERIKYEGSGRNIFVAQAETEIQKLLATGVTDKPGIGNAQIYQAPAVAPAPPIPLKFFGFASKPGEPKRIFLSKGDDVFIAGEGEIVDRRYKVVRISPTSVDIQDVVGSGPPQSIPLTQG